MPKRNPFISALVGVRQLAVSGTGMACGYSLGGALGGSHRLGDDALAFLHGTPDGYLVVAALAGFIPFFLIRMGFAAYDYDLAILQNRDEPTEKLSVIAVKTTIGVAINAACLILAVCVLRGMQGQPLIGNIGGLERIGLGLGLTAVWLFYLIANLGTALFRNMVDRANRNRSQKSWQA